MKVLYDHQVFSWQKIGGISRYFVELMKHLPNDVEWKDSIVLSDNVYLKECSKVFKNIYSLPNLKGKGRIYGYVNRLNSDCYFKKNDYDIFHPTYYDTYFLNRIKKPYVITVYDMIHEKYPQLFPDNTIDNKFKTILNADKVIAISENTKRDIVDIYGLDPNKIQVIYLGHSVNSMNVACVDGLPERYILFVGARNTYKNFTNFLRAFAILSNEDRNLNLVCTGSRFNDEEIQLIISLGLSDKIKLYFVNDAQLTFLYKNALCFVYPSIYEGFGIPILEAFATDCPIALSNASCFPEIAGEGGLYFNPEDIDSMSDVIRKLIYDNELRKFHITKGHERLKFFSWQKMAQETADLYKELIV